ncbi:MAG TPA: hypothetical protein VLG37_01360 [Candidatus Saccharimonadales bacterium]|nr:hypothetical protein [Candidatus Saccharimonadales bacterium]
MSETPDQDKSLTASAPESDTPIDPEIVAKAKQVFDIAYKYLTGEQFEKDVKSDDVPETKDGRNIDSRVTKKSLPVVPANNPKDVISLSLTELYGNHLSVGIGFTSLPPELDAKNSGAWQMIFYLDGTLATFSAAWHLKEDPEKTTSRMGPPFDGTSNELMGFLNYAVDSLQDAQPVNKQINLNEVDQASETV